MRNDRGLSHIFNILFLIGFGAFICWSSLSEYGPAPLFWPKTEATVRGGRVIWEHHSKGGDSYNLMLDYDYRVAKKHFHDTGIRRKFNTWEEDAAKRELGKYLNKSLVLEAYYDPKEPSHSVLIQIQDPWTLGELALLCLVLMVATMLAPGVSTARGSAVRNDEAVNSAQSGDSLSVYAGVINLALVLTLIGATGWAIYYYSTSIQSIEVEPDPKKRIKEIDEKLARKPADAAVLYRKRAEANHSLGSEKKAEDDFAESITLDPKDAKTFKSLAQFHKDLGKNTLSLKDLDKVIELEPGDDEAYFDRGLICFRLKSYAAARNDYFKAAQLNSIYFEDLGDAELKLHHYQQAKDAYDKSISEFPDGGQAYFHRSKAESHLELRAEASKDLAAAKKLGYVAED